MWRNRGSVYSSWASSTWSHAADVRAPTPSAASELVVWSKRDLEEQIDYQIAFQARQLNNLVQQARQQLDSILQRPVFARPLDIVLQQQQYLDSLVRLLRAAGKNRFDVFKNKLSLILSRLEALSPLKTLSRGYSVSRKTADLSLVKSFKDISPGELMETILADGRLISMVKERKT